MSGYIGNIPTPQATQTRDTFTATAGQTTFATSGYTPSFLDVFLNGVHLVNGTDYTASNGSDVVLTSGAAAGDTLEVVAYSTFEVNSQTFTGTTTLTGDLQATTATFSGAVTGTDATLSGGVYLGGTGAANYLDDYEEGTFTPFLYGSSTAGSPTYSTRSGYYTKVGRLVTIGVQLVLSNKGGMSGEIRVGGIPFAASSTSQDREAGLVRLNTGITTTETYNVFPFNGDTNCIFRSCNTATDNSIGDSEISNNTTFQFGLTYRTS